MAEEKETPAQKLASRTGKCSAIGCRGCEGFEFVRHMDGFPMCDCQHTQWSHAKVVVQTRVAEAVPAI